jgi:hypothetical protein
MDEKTYTVNGMTCSHCVMTFTYLTWAAAIGASGCGRCVAAA